MKWIKSRIDFVSEAKIRDLTFPRQQKEIIAQWGEKYLDYEEVTPTENINQGKWKLNEEDKNKLLSSFFRADIPYIYQCFSSIPDKFADILEKSIDINLLDDKKKLIFEKFSAKKPTVDQMICLYDNIFRKLSVGETKADEIISKDEFGKPLKDAEDKLVKVKKIAGDPIFSKNLVNISTFITEYSLCYSGEPVPASLRNNNDILKMIDISKNTFNPEFNVSYQIFDRDIYLSIIHNPKNILNVTITKFYSSCQHLYTGEYRKHILSSVFDPNTIPAFFIIETPITWNDEVISEVLPISRLLIRSVEGYDESKSDTKKLFFDMTYPDRCRNVCWELVKKYSNNTPSNETLGREYLWFADIDPNDDESMILPYMDSLAAKKADYIGSNAKNIRFTNKDWSKVKISPKASIESIIIETPNLPESLFKLNLNPKWIKFKFMKINDLSVFSKFKSESIGFDKCSLDPSMISELSNIKNLLFTGCDLSNTKIKSDSVLDELKIIYTLDPSSKLEEVLSEIKFKSLEISSDLLLNSENKIYINSLRKNNIKVKISGPQI